MRYIFLITALLAAFLGKAGTYTPSQVPNVQKTDRACFVSNPDGILSPQAVDGLDEALGRMRSDLSVEPAVVVVDNIDDPSDASDFATELFELWGLGKADKDNGLLFLLVVDQRSATIRPGYGLEGALPDITCGRIIREVIAPAAADGDYDSAVLGAVGIMGNILSDPVLAEEYRSQLPDNYGARDEDDLDPFVVYVCCACVIAVFLLLMFLGRLASLRGKSDYEKYRAMESYKPWFLILTAACLFIPLIASVPLLLCLNHWRNHPRKCPNCSAKMKKVDEVHDNDYLTPAQDLEERIGSVDYDVWLCPDCGETDILAYTLPSSTYVECENCHARTARPVGYRVITKPTSTTRGRGVKEYDCLNCKHRTRKYFDIERDMSGVATAAAAGAILGGRGGGGGFGGGFSGGGFGGGHTGGGGATGRW